MQYVDTTGTVPIKLWLDDLEHGAMEQARNLAEFPFTFKHVAVMPDAHKGYGMPIGTVLASRGAVVPNAVGVDIGCGMLARQFEIPADILKPEGVRGVLGHIRDRVPVGNGKKGTRDGQKYVRYPDVGGTLSRDHAPGVVAAHFETALTQVGTLGGGNHFIELQAGSDGYLWAMIHSGSRALGYAVATHYNKLAQRLNQTWHSSVPKDHGLAFLPVGSPEADAYMAEMNYCIRYAEINREEMMGYVGDALNEVVGASPGETVHNSHNYARMENHFGENVLIHRKGATSAREGELGIIPGSQGTNSYIVAGKGEKQSFTSCSHGAGRLMSRNRAKSELDMAATVEDLDTRGILHSIRSVSDMDEAPGAYKDIHTVMALQQDLVDIRVELSPLGVVKG